MRPPTPFSFPAIVNKQQDEAIAPGRATITPGGTETSHQPGARGRLAPHTALIYIIKEPRNHYYFFFHSISRYSLTDSLLDFVGYQLLSNFCRHFPTRLDGCH